MTDGRIEDLWLRFIAGQDLSPDEKLEMTDALRADPDLRNSLLGDAELDGILRGLGLSRRDAGPFTQGVDLYLAAEADRDAFLQRLAARTKAEGVLRPRTDRFRRSRNTPWEPVLIAAAAVLLIGILYAVLDGSKPAAPKIGKPPVAGKPGPLTEPPPTRETVHERAVERRPDSDRKSPDVREPAPPVQQADAPRKPEEPPRREIERKPEPGRPEPPPALPTVASVAKAVVVEGPAFVVTAAGKRAAKGAEDLFPGDGLEVARAAVVTYPDGTRFEIGPDTDLRDLRVEGGKRLFVAHGTVRADVKKQPKDQPTVFLTPHGEAKVRGTTLRLVVDKDPRVGTRLEVTEGAVELKRESDGKAVEVVSGHLAVAATGVDLATHPIYPDTPPGRLLQASGWVTINFGAEGAKLPEGVLNDSGQEFDARRGYGWKGPNSPAPPEVDLRGLRRLAWPAPANSDVLKGTGVEAGWFNHTETWVMPVPNGRYRVSLCCGDLVSLQGPHHVRVENVQLVQATVTPVGKFVEVTAVLEVKDGELTVVVGGHGTRRTDDAKSSSTVLNFIRIQRDKK